jgi:hypothetical protein
MKKVFVMACVMLSIRNTPMYAQAYSIAPHVPNPTLGQKLFSPEAYRGIQTIPNGEGKDTDVYFMILNEHNNGVDSLNSFKWDIADKVAIPFNYPNSNIPLNRIVFAASGYTQWLCSQRGYIFESWIPTAFYLSYDKKENCYTGRFEGMIAKGPRGKYRMVAENLKINPDGTISVSDVCTTSASDGTKMGALLMVSTFGGLLSGAGLYYLSIKDMFGPQ